MRVGTRVLEECGIRKEVIIMRRGRRRFGFRSRRRRSFGRRRRSVRPMRIGYRLS